MLPAPPDHFTGTIGVAVRTQFVLCCIVLSVNPVYSPALSRNVGYSPALSRNVGWSAGTRQAIEARGGNL